MKKLVLILFAAAMLVPATAVAGDEDAEASRTLNGQYVWNQRGKSGDLEAVFTPAGENTWDVSFHFSFRDQDHTYTGKAEGDLARGELKGKVLNEGGKRTFVFRGSFESGEFSGTHAEIGENGEFETGTLTLRE